VLKVRGWGTSGCSNLTWSGRARDVTLSIRFDYHKRAINIISRKFSMKETILGDGYVAKKKRQV